MEKIRLLIFLIFIFVVKGNTFVTAQEVNLDKIVVTPSRIQEDYSESPKVVDVVTSEDIERSLASDLAGVLSVLPSLNIGSYGGIGSSKTLKMRGSTASQVLVMVDGRPVNSPRDGEVDLSTLPLDNIDRIEVVHGASSSLYGSSGMGGTVNILTKNPPKKGFKTELFTGFSTFRTYNERFQHGGRVSKFGYVLSGAYQSSEGARDNSKFNAKDLNSKLSYSLNDNNDIIINSGFYKSYLGAPGRITSTDTDDKQRVIKNFLDLSWAFSPQESLNIKTKIYNSYDRLEFIENTAGSIFDTAFDKSVHTTKVQGLDLQLDKQLSDLYGFGCGFNYVSNLNDSNKTAKHTYNVKAWHIENRFDLSNKFRFTLNSRIDDYSNFGSQLSPASELVYRFDQDNRLRLSISRSFRAPTFNDLYWPDDGWSKGNPDLKPEKGTTAEFGTDIKFNSFVSSSFSYYRSDYNQLIVWAPDLTGIIWQPQNIGSAIIDGIEFANKITISKQFELDLNYSWLRAKDEKTKKYLVYQPNNKIDAVFRYTNADDLTFELKGQYVDRRFHNTENSIYVRRYFVFGAGVSKKLNDTIICYASINNLTNRSYQVVNEYPMPGFSFDGGIKLVF